MLRHDARSVREADDLNWREKFIMVPLVLAMFGLGVLPGPTLDLIKPDAALMYQAVSNSGLVSASAVLATSEGGAQ